LYLFIA